MKLVEISADTLQYIKEILQKQKIESKSLRIQGRIGWGGMSYSLVLDEPAHGDQVEKYDNFWEKIMGRIKSWKIE